MRVVLTAAEGLPLGTAPLSLTIQEHLPPVPGPMCHSQVTVSCLEIQHFSVTLDCFVVNFCTCLLLHSQALKVIVISPHLSSSLGNMS